MEEIINETKTALNEPQLAELNLEIHDLRRRLMQANQVIERLSDERALARINFLFKMLKYAEMFPQEVVKKTIEELTLVMFPVEEENANE
jgi:hypothetical protein